MRAYQLPMGIQRLFPIFVALAVMFAPAAARAGEAFAAMPDRQMQMMEMSGACHMPAKTPADHDRSMGKNCCISMCMAVAVAPSVPAEHSPLRQQVAQFAPLKAYRGLLSEIATPPPRRS